MYVWKNFCHNFKTPVFLCVQIINQAVFIVSLSSDRDKIII